MDRTGSRGHKSVQECKKPIIFLEASKVIDNRGGSVGPTPRFMAYPQSAFLRPLPAEIPDPYPRRDFDEAVAVLPLSSKGERRSQPSESAGDHTR